ncbi:SRPBCC family protein [Kitasatospora sp. NPDC051853]|uniref:SRPBCC family protein n=1 Tax=Kitasatospora sp. NPDC051853 TaxID=3364058 RepID=UPI0037A9D7D5
MNVHIDRTAPAVVELSTTVRAPLARLWELHTDIAAWPAWLPDVTAAETDGRPLAVGSVFRWHTHGLDITSTVLELVPGRRIVWGGPAHGIEGVHVWTFEETDGGEVTVRTEESWSGAPVDAEPEALGQALRQSLESWLTTLRSTAESR